MTVTNVQTSTGSPSATSQTSTQKTLGKDDFLKLFVAQMQNQDPTNPTDNSQFMAQMAQFSQLEQTTNLAKTSEQMATSLGISQSLGLLGKTVTYVDAQKVRHTGVVEKVVTEGGTATLTIDGTPGIAPASVAEVSTP